MKKYKQLTISFENINKFYASAVKKFKRAGKAMSLDEETAYQMFYESMLKASLALMLSYGVRPRSLPGHHVAIIEFTAKKLGSSYAGIMATFNTMRRKRNQSIYEATVVITEREARNALGIAKKYLEIIKQHIESNNPQLKLKF